MQGIVVLHVVKLNVEDDTCVEPPTPGVSFGVINMVSF